MSGLVVNTNVASLIAQQNLHVTNAQLKVSVQRLSSGYRVNSAADDAAGLARADQLKSYSVAIGAAMRNANDSISALEVVDKSAEKITDLLIRMNELAASAAQGTLDSQTRGYYSSEYDKLSSEINRIVATTEFGGSKLMNGDLATLDIFVGFRNSGADRLQIGLADYGGTNATAVSTKTYATGGTAVTALTQDFSFTVGGVSYTTNVVAGTSLNNFITQINNMNAGVTASKGGANPTNTLVLTSHNIGAEGTIAITNDLDGADALAATTTAGTNSLSITQGALATQNGAQGALDTVRAAIKSVNDARAVYGAYTNRVQSTVANLEVTFTNFKAAESRIRDADFAQETAMFTRNQIMVQSGTTVLAQANLLPQSALTLLG